VDGEGPRTFVCGARAFAFCGLTSQVKQHRQLVLRDHCDQRKQGLDCRADLVERQVIEAAELVLPYGANPTLDELLPPVENQCLL